MEARGFVDAIESLRGAVQELATKSDAQQAVIERVENVALDTNHNRKVLRIALFGLIFTIVGFVFDSTLTGFGVHLFRRVNSNTNTVQEIQDRTSNQVLCPLYKLLTVAIAEQPLPAEETPAQTALRLSSVRVVQSGSLALRC